MVQFSIEKLFLITGRSVSIKLLFRLITLYFQMTLTWRNLTFLYHVNWRVKMFQTILIPKFKKFFKEISCLCKVRKVFNETTVEVISHFVVLIFFLTIFKFQ